MEKEQDLEMIRQMYTGEELEGFIEALRVLLYIAETSLDAQHKALFKVNEYDFQTKEYTPFWR